MSGFALKLGLLIAQLVTVPNLVYARGPNPTCRTNNQFRDAEDYRDYIHEIGIFGDVDQRKTVEEFATEISHEKVADVKKRYGPTGTFICGNGSSEGSAQLTGDSDVITTASHVFEGDNCDQRVNPNNCKFSIDTAEGHQEFEVERVVGQGFVCPRTHGATIDWAVLKLKKKAKGVKPYRIDSAAVSGMLPGRTVVNVCHSLDFVRHENGQKVTPKHIQICKLKYVSNPPTPEQMLSACDASKYCSGGSLLSANQDDPALLGVVQGGGESYQAAKRAYDTETPVKGTYNNASWSTTYVPVTGRFLEAIKAASSVNPERPAEPTPPQWRPSAPIPDQRPATKKSSQIETDI